MHHQFQDFFISFIQIKQLKSIIKKLFEQTIDPIYRFQAKDIKHDMCPPCFTLSKINPSKIGGLHYELHLKPNLLTELCVINYCTNDGLVNGAKGYFKIAT